MKHFVAYHKFKEWGNYDTTSKVFAHYSGKSLKHLEKTIGQRVWVIGGKLIDRKMQYNLLSCFSPRTVEEDQDIGYNVEGEGIGLDFPNNLLNYPWFLQLKEEQQNFSFGLNEIKSQEVIDGLLNLLQEFEGPLSPLSEEIPITEKLIEGGRRKITVNAYGRSTKAREACIKHYGAICQVCKFNFEEQYGLLGKGFIHVHHLTRLSDTTQEYEVDPIKDLLPVCPNCHTMLHQGNFPPDIDKLRELIKKPFPW